MIEGLTLYQLKERNKYNEKIILRYHKIEHEEDYENYVNNAELMEALRLQ